MQRTSFTRFETYEKCPSKYEKTYVLKLPVVQQLNPSLLLGSLAHGVIEEWLDPNTEITKPHDAFELYLPAWLREAGLPEDIIQPALELAPGYASLLLRASPSYVEADALRKKDGTIAQDLENFPPTSWTNAVRSKGLAPIKGELDNIASVESPVFRKTSFSHLIGMAYFMSCYLEIPEWVDRTLSVESGYSVPIEGKDELETPIAFPGRDDLYVNAYLDWVVETKDGRVVIIDHKSSKKAPSELEVSHHAQLNLYAWLHYEHTEELPDVIGINHMRSQTIVLAPVDPEVVQGVMKNLVATQTLIEAGVFPKRLPGAYNSPCVKRDWKSGELTEVCPFLEQCWPQFYRGIEDELPED